MRPSIILRPSPSAGISQKSAPAGLKGYLPNRRFQRQSHLIVHSSVTPSTVSQAGGGNDGGSGPPNNGDSDGDGGGDEGGSVDSGLGLMLAAAGRTVTSLPADIQKGMASGFVSTDLLKRYLYLDSHWFFGLFMSVQGFRERLLSDPGFFVKVGIECGIGIVTKCTAEWEKRKGSFSKELDFVTANVIMAIIADFMLVWLPAPTMKFAAASSGSKAAGNALSRYFASCPDNAFQKVPPSMKPWSLAQRAGAPLRNGAKLLGVGFGASMLGVGITNALIFVRGLLDPEFKSPNAPQNPAVVSSAYAVYMATSSNLRYQVVAGVFEERGIEMIFAGKPNVCHTLSLILRTANTFLGSLMWVDFVRIIGLQPKQPAVQAAK